MRPILCIVTLLLVSATAEARNIEAGSLWMGGGVGPASKLGSKLGGSGGYLMLSGRGEYAFSKSITAVGDIGLGLADTKPLRLHIGGRYRFADLDLPLSPYVQGQLTMGRLFDVIGADLNVLGLRAAGGADYFLTAGLAAGALVAFDFTSTFSERSAFFGTFEVQVYGSYAF